MVKTVALTLLATSLFGCKQGSGVITSPSPTADKVAGIGESCSDQLGCVENAYCNGSSHICVAIPGKQKLSGEGESCSNEKGCIPNTYCDGQTNTCIALKPDPCVVDPCKNGGTCLLRGDAVQCECPLGFVGDRCEKAVPIGCETNECQNDSTCKPTTTGYRCECKDNYFGERCQYKPQPNDKNKFIIKVFVQTYNDLGYNWSGAPIPFYIGVNPKFAGQYNYNVDCNSDGIIDYKNEKDGVLCDYRLRDDYATKRRDGYYTITITGNYPAPYFKCFEPEEHIKMYNEDDPRSKNGLVEIVDWGPQKWKSLNSAFLDCRNLRSVGLTTPDLSELEADGLEQTFEGAISFNSPIGHWNISNSTSLWKTFKGAVRFNQDLSTWNTENVIYLDSTFQNAASFNQDIATWNTSKLRGLPRTFMGASSFNQDISGWNVSSVENMDATFEAATSFNQNLKSWETAKPTTCYDYSNYTPSWDPSFIPKFTTCKATPTH